MRAVPHTAMTELRQAEIDAANDTPRPFGAVTAFEPTAWTLVRTRLWRKLPTDLVRPGIQLYEVGYLGLGGGQ